MEWETITPNVYPKWIVQSLRNDDLRAAWEGGRLLLFRGRSYTYRVSPEIISQGHWDIGRMERQLRRPPRQRRSPLMVVAATAAITAVLVGVAALALVDAQGSTQTTPAADSDYRGRGTCTGSMAPTMTCVDEVTVRPVFAPEDIKPGHIIVFQPGCPGEGGIIRPVVHRVIEVRQDEGGYSYWPKGDAKREADGCWIPAEFVQGYVVEVHRDVRPENTELRDEMAAARAALTAIMDRYCGVGVGADDCELETTAQHDEIVAARDHALCWHGVAQAAEYDGHIPSRC